MVLVINRMVLIALILCSISGSFAQEPLEFADESVSATTCPYMYMCRTKQAFASNTCAYYSAADSTFYTKACSSGYTCSASGVVPSNYTCSKTITPSTSQMSLIGEYCSKDDDCKAPYSTKCSSNKCVAASKAGASCLTGANPDHLWCPAGQYCLATTNGAVTTAVCTDAAKTGGACLTDQYCANSAGCNIAAAAVTATGTCVPYLSLKTGDAVLECNIPAGGTTATNLLCASSLCGVKSGAAGTWVCVDQVKSAGSTPQSCTTQGAFGGSCVSVAETATGAALTSMCTCGYSTNGAAYCEIFPGDSAYQSYLKYTAKWATSSGISKCNTVGRFNELCQKAQWNSGDRNTWAYYNYLVADYANVQMVDDCTLDTLLAGYKTLKDKYDSSASFFALSALAMMVFA